MTRESRTKERYISASPARNRCGTLSRNSADEIGNSPTRHVAGQDLAVHSLAMVGEYPPMQLQGAVLQGSHLQWYRIPQGAKDVPTKSVREFDLL